MAKPLADKLLQLIISNSPNIKDDLESEINNRIEEKVVVGIDIYKYSTYEKVEQSLIPVLFDILYDLSVRFCTEFNEFIFSKLTKEKIEKDFINSGDGGFQIFDNPLQGLIFIISFASHVRAYNSNKLSPEEINPQIRDIVGELSLRYALTKDDLFEYRKNYYGASIINNARIMSKDKLNRCLIDENTYEWFIRNVNGIENLQFITLKDVKKLNCFKSYGKVNSAKKSNIIPINKSCKSAIYATHVQKIDEIEAKGVFFSTYNLHMQIYLQDSKKSDMGFAISLGNLNTSGLN